MAETKETKKEERVYVIPLRRSFLKVPKFRRTEKAVNTIREFIIKHMKASDVKIGKYLNKDLWSRGHQKPPGKVKVVAIKYDKSIVKVEIFGAPEEKPKEEKKKIEKPKEEKAKEETKQEEERKKLKLPKVPKLEKHEHQQRAEEKLVNVKPNIGEANVIGETGKK